MALQIRKNSRILLNAVHRIIFENPHFYASGVAVETVDAKEGSQRKMKGWQIHAYGNLDELQFSDKMRIPIISSPTDILVRVEHAGVNSIDIAMIGGYGASLLNTMRCSRNEIEFPLVLGREFSGTVVQKGLGCGNDINRGDKVFGVVPVHKQGSHAEYVTVPYSCVTLLPTGISPPDASAVLYAGLTAWSGLFVSGLLGGIQGSITSQGGGRGKRVLVLGGAGGVGSMAVQILKAENAAVIASCSTDAVPILNSLGVQHVIDYTKEEELEEFIAYGPYDIILDCAGQGAEYAYKFNWKFENYVTFSSPLLRNFDEHGLGFGAIKNLFQLIEHNTKSLTNSKGCIKYGYFLPAPHGIEYLKTLMERGKLLPIIDSTYKFDELPKAYQRIQERHLIGKVVINIEKT